MSTALMTREQKEGAISPHLQNMNLLMEDSLPELLLRIPTLPDDLLEDLVGYAERMERFAFIVRGAAAYEVQTRIATRLVGGRGQADVDQKGVTAEMKRLADTARVALRTLQRDAQIHKTFFHDTQTGVPHDVSFLSRHYYEEALTAPDPKAAIEIAKQKYDTVPGYNIEQFKRDVSTLKGADERKVPAPNLEEVYWLNSIPISLEARDALLSLSRKLSKSHGDVLTQVLKMAGETLVEGIVVRGDAARSLHNTHQRLCPEMEMDAFLLLSTISYEQVHASGHTGFIMETAQHAAEEIEQSILDQCCTPGDAAAYDVGVDTAAGTPVVEMQWKSGDLAREPRFQQMLRDNTPLRKIAEEFQTSFRQVHTASRLIKTGNVAEVSL